MEEHAMANTKILILVLIAISLLCCDARSISKEEHLKMKRELKRLNKPAVESIQTEYGDIFDCVDIYKQPAFDHPLLKNHTIQMSPISYPKGMENKHPSNTNLEFGLKEGGCPFGTIPIRRTTMQDLLRAKSLSDFGRKLTTDGIHHYAIISQVGEWFGTRATMNVWNPLVSDNRQFSLAQLWIVNGPIDQLNTIEAGWNVYPELYGGGTPRLFVFWTSDSYKTTGCYNLLCPGFVQVSKDIVLGSILRTSVYNGDQQEEVTLAVFKEKSTGDWWLTFGDDLVPVGYWPQSIFTSLADKSTGTDWGGETCTPEGIKSPPMGSGQFPNEGFKKASYMRRLQYVDDTYTFKDIPNTFRDVPNGGYVYSDLQCYKLQDDGNIGGFWGRNFFFGGPGGC